ncbi:unnamed protein product [Hermetia illucens]|uniref:Uncharacterized protein n=1 Tax=Hermetia illucens TaxID=343691 RepID=A0A7R8UGJ7_HERIL|nr:diuretic hormone class 2 [Hermetia illucens]CAD7080157.1 unnamed protein product [Hermetia illucens]
MSSKGCITTIAVVGLSLLLATLTESAPMPRYYNYYDAMQEIPRDELMAFIARLGETVLKTQYDLGKNAPNMDLNHIKDQSREYASAPGLPYNNEDFLQLASNKQDHFGGSKRTVDFGLARGYSGIQELKHRMGMAAANYAGGPGRRRRSETEA